MMRVTELAPTDDKVLRLLLCVGPMNGAALMLRGIKAGSVYGSLERLESNGLVKSRREPRGDSNGGVALRVFEPTHHARPTLKLQPHIKTVQHFVLPGEAMAELVPEQDYFGCSECGEPVAIYRDRTMLDPDMGHPPVQCSYCKRFLTKVTP